VQLDAIERIVDFVALDSHCLDHGRFEEAEISHGLK
jgi:hypothetical protein